MSWTRREITRWIRNLNEQIETTHPHLTVEENEFFEVLGCMTVVLKFIRDKQPPSSIHLDSSMETNENDNEKNL